MFIFLVTDKKALSITQEDIEKQFEIIEKTHFDNLVTKIKKWIDDKNVDALIKNIRYDQKISLDIYSLLTGDNIKSKSNEELKKYFNTKFGKNESKDNDLSDKKAYEMTKEEYEDVRQKAETVFNNARYIDHTILNTNYHFYQLYKKENGGKISDVEDYMKFLLKNDPKTFTQNDYDTYQKYKDLRERKIMPDWRNHGTLVQMAINDGKKIPDIVLKEYPNYIVKFSDLVELARNSKSVQDLTDKIEKSGFISLKVVREFAKKFGDDKSNIEKFYNSVI